MGLIDDFKEVVKTVQKIDNIDLYRKILDLQSEVMSLFNENQELKKELTAIRETADVRSKLELRNGLYYLKADHQGRPDGPYCTKCFDADEKLILVTELSKEFLVIGRYRCPNCKMTFGGK